MTDNLSDFVIKELSKHHNRNEIIRAVCERGGLNWAEAEKFLKKVEAENHRTITTRQSPFLFALSFALMIMGAVFLVYNVVFFIDYWNADAMQKALLLQSAIYRGIGLLTGLGMLIGGLIGLFQTASSIFKD